MAGVTMRLDVDFAPVTELLSTLERIPDDMSAVMDEIGRMLVDSTVVRFTQTNTAPDGTPWKPSQRAQKNGDKTLLDDGILMGSITRNFDNNSVEVGTNRVYAAIQQFGGDINIQSRRQQVYFRQNKKTGNVGNRFVKRSRSNFAQQVTLPAYQITLPARPFLGVSAEDADNVLDIISKFIKSEILH